MKRKMMIVLAGIVSSVFASDIHVSPTGDGSDGLLGSDCTVAWREAEGGLTVTFPTFSVGEAPVEFAPVFKIERTTSK